VCGQTEKQTDGRTRGSPLRRRLNPEVAQNITQYPDVTFHKSLPIFRSKSVTPEFAVQQPGLATLRRYLGEFAKSREMPITTSCPAVCPNASSRLPLDRISMKWGGGYYENLSRNPNLVKIGHITWRPKYDALLLLVTFAINALSSSEMVSCC